MKTIRNQEPNLRTFQLHDINLPTPINQDHHFQKVETWQCGLLRGIKMSTNADLHTSNRDADSNRKAKT